MVLDLDVMVRAMRSAAAHGTQAQADKDCGAVPTPFDGTETAAFATGRRNNITRTELLTGAVELPVAEALDRRGALVVNGAGRVGIVVALNTVVQPAGRVMALTTTSPEHWVTGWWPAGVTSTLTSVPW